MTVYIIKHHATDVYVSNNEYHVSTTTDLKKAYRFISQAKAEQCRQRMKVPIGWRVIPREFDNGEFVE